MKQLISDIKETMQAIESDILLYEGKRIKAASARVRRNSLKLEKMLKQFRRESIEEDKKTVATK